jgi:hypothetical protein
MAPSLRPLVFALTALGIHGAAIADDTEAATAQARQWATQLVQQTGAALKKELAATGPEGAIGVCKQVAPDIAGNLSRANGVRVARVSLKVRNAVLGHPDAWEQAVLADFDRRAAAGEKPDAMERAEIVSEPAGRYFRYMKAIPTQPMCLACHGAPEALAPSIAERLAAEYPKDRATGYSVGQIRGAVTVKRLLDTP